MATRRRAVLALLPSIAASLVARAQPQRGTGPAGPDPSSGASRMVPVTQPQAVPVGAGTQSGVTTGSSGPQEKEGGDTAAAGSLSSTNPGGGGAQVGAGAPGTRKKP